MNERKTRSTLNEEKQPGVEAGVNACRDAIFIWIPKVAGTSISALLQNEDADILKRRHLLGRCKNRGISCFGHMKVTDLAAAGIIHQEYLDRAFKFSFVRNPWDRCVSLYSYLTKISTKGRSPVRSSMSFSRFCLGLLLAEFLNVGFKIPPVGLKHVDHLSQCNSQLDWLTDGNGALITDYIGRYENLEDDFDYVRARLGLRGSLPTKNMTPQRGSYRSYYTGVTKAIVGYVYRRDVSTFGYEF